MKNFVVLCVFLLSLFAAGVYSDIQKETLQAIQTGVEKLTISVAPTRSLVKAVKSIYKTKDKLESKDTICKSCQIVVNYIISYRRTGASKDSMITYLNKICGAFSDEGSAACKGYVDIEIDTILFIIDNKTDLTPERVCAIYLQGHKCVDPAAKKWNIPLPPALNDTGATALNVNASPLKILHLTDIHYDPLYQPGSNAECDEPLCCQSGTPTDLKNAAGYWGDYHVCDMPLHSVENLLSHIEQNYIKDIDYVYYTGDIISHKSWATSKEQNIKTITEIYTKFSEKFGNKTVYPILGNHEPHPTDFYSSDDVVQDNVTTGWVFNLSATVWSKWLPQETQTTIKKGGYYSTLVKPGFRIIALNSNVCFTSNLWLIYDDEDPYKQLQWLVEELYKAEQQKEKVHILSHIPPGEIMCHKQWSSEFHKIINRFADTISAQFNGHTHVDELRVFYSPDNPNRVINVAFNGASFTTFVGYNPNFRIYQVDPSDAMVQDYDQYIYNLTKANEQTTAPEWYKLYSFKDAYGFPDMGLQRFEELLNKMASDSNIMWQYFRFLVRDSDVKLKEGCNALCLHQLLCYITAVETDDSVNC